MKIKRGQTNISLDREELSTIENAIAVLNDLIIASEEENEAPLFGRCGEEFLCSELCDVRDILEAITDAKGEFTLR